VDGFIAQKGGVVDAFPGSGEPALAERFPETRNDFTGESKVFDTVLMGRKTYEFGLNLGVSNPYSTLKQYLFSGSMQKSPDENIELISEHSVDFIRDLKAQPGKAIWLCGGGELSASLFEASLIDLLILKINPVLFGSGIPLFKASRGALTLQHLESEVFESGLVLSQYRPLY